MYYSLHFIVICILSIHYGQSADKCIKRSQDSKIFDIISPCPAQYTDGTLKSKNDKRKEEFPAIYIGEYHVYVSTDRFMVKPTCVTTDMLPDTLKRNEVSGAGISRKYLHLLFHNKILRVKIPALKKWFNGTSDKGSISVVSIPPYRSQQAHATSLTTSPCCFDTKWCDKMGRFTTAYTFHNYDSSNNSKASGVLHRSENEGETYENMPVKLPSGSKPVMLAQYPTQIYSSIFYNHGGKGHILRIRDECKGANDCVLETVTITDVEIKYVEMETTMKMLTVLVTKGNRLLVSGRHDEKFNPMPIIYSHTMKETTANSSGPQGSMKGFSSDRVRWILIVDDDWVFLGKSQSLWTTSVHTFQLGSKPPRINAGRELISGATTPDHSRDGAPEDEQNTGSSKSQKGENTTEAPAAATNASGRAMDDAGVQRPERSASTSKQVAVDGRATHYSYVLQGRQLHIASLAEDKGGKNLIFNHTTTDMTPHLKKLDLSCELYKLEVTYNMTAAELVVDKNDSLTFLVSLQAAKNLAVRPLLLMPQMILVSEMQSISSIPEIDGSITTNWIINVTNHPENMAKPYMNRTYATEIQVTSTVKSAECPAEMPSSVPVLVGCNPSLKLIALNKRVDDQICNEYKKEGLTIPSSVKGDPLLRFQQQIRGKKAVYKKGKMWKVKWHNDWGCPLLSSHKAEFEPVIAIMHTNNNKTERILHKGLSTLMYDLHGLRDFDFLLKHKEIGCHKRQYPGVSWRESCDHFFRKHKSNISSFVMNPHVILNTTNYNKCDNESEPEKGDGAHMVTNPFFEVFGVKTNKILWKTWSQPIHVLTFRVVEPTYTYCDLTLTIPVFFMHSSDVSEGTKLIILLIGILVGLLLIITIYVAEHVSRELKRNKKEHMDSLLAAADLFVTSPFNSRLDLTREHIKTK